MRITNNTLTGNYLRNLSRNLEKMQTYQNQLSTGKEVSKPSDNPMLVSKIMNLDTSIKDNEQYKSSIDSAMDWANTADSALGSVTDALQRIRELVVEGANGTLDDSDRASIAAEVKELTKQTADCLNAKIDGRYIFGGQKTTEPPFSINADGVMVYSGDGNNISREIAPNLGVTIPSDGSKITTAGTSDLGALLADISKALESGDTNALSGTLLSSFDKNLDNAVLFRSKMGAIYNRLEAAGQRNEAQDLGLTELLSKNSDIDIAEKMMEYSTMSAVYQASLSSGAKILQTSLLDYLR
jgi:flagellar hook-associated protein 3 FlgL